MEGDRAAVLTLRSAVNGVIDYSKADIHNDMWWKRWRYLLNSMASVERGELLKQAYQFSNALVSNSKLSPDSFSSVQRNSKELYEDITYNQNSWIGTKEDREIAEKEKFAEQWKAISGFELDDQEAKAEWEEKLRNYQSESKSEAFKAEQQMEDVRANFEAKRREILDKRRKQQGR